MLSLGSPPAFIIRPMTELDLDPVIKIDQASFSLPWPERAFKYEITSNENSIPLVAEVQKPDGELEIAGFIVVWLIIDEAHIGTIAVAEPYRHTGLGEAITREGLKRTRQRGALQAFLEVRRGNAAAIHLYEKLGFMVDGTRPRYYADNQEDAILMSLRSMENL